MDRSRHGEEAITPEATRFLPWLDFAMWTVHTSPATLVLFAQIGQPVSWDLFLPVAGMVAVVALGLWAIVKVKRWRDEADEIRGLSPDEQLAQYETMAKDGLLDPEELAQIKARLAARFDPPPAIADTTETPPSQPPDNSIQEK